MICKSLNDYKTPRHEIYRIVQARANCNLRVKLKKLQEKALKEGMSSGKAKQLNILDLIAKDPELREIYIDVVNEMAIKYGVSI
ncbi:hypothetical protein [Clostridium ganghwense]|nr:hypothetical protein [Clostridium ganghwense]